MGGEKEFSHVMKIDLQVHGVEEILESREDPEVQAVIHRAVKIKVEEENREVDREIDREVDPESRKKLLAENQKEDRLLAVLPLAPEVETEVEVEPDRQVVQGEGEKNLIQEVAKDQIEKLEKVELEAQVVNGKNLHSQIGQGHRQKNGMLYNSEKVLLLLERLRKLLTLKRNLIEMLIRLSQNQQKREKFKSVRQWRSKRKLKRQILSKRSPMSLKESLKLE